jgi:hypothetical protein
VLIEGLPTCRLRQWLCAVRDMDTKYKIFEVMKKYLTQHFACLILRHIFLDMATTNVDTEVNLCAVFCTDNFFCVRDLTFVPHVRVLRTQNRLAHHKIRHYALITRLNITAFQVILCVFSDSYQ